jgi:non-heme chloroperoxidase
VTSRRVTANGASLSVVDSGKGRPVVFLHGVMCSGRLFEPQVAHFSRGHRVVVPDFRGHGDSERTPGGHTVPNYARDMAALFEAIGVDRPVLVGWSMGAMVAYEYLREAGSEGVAGLVIVDQPPADFAWGGGYDFGLFTPEVLAESIEAIQTDVAAVAEEWAELMLHDPTPESVALLAGELAKVPPAIGTSILVDQTLRDYREFIPGIRVPTLVAFGGDDKATDPAAGKWIADAVPGSRLEIFDRSSHCPFFEEPEAFNRALEEFLAGL